MEISEFAQNIHKTGLNSTLSRDIIESVLLDIIINLLPGDESENLGVNDNFFNCGGDSMMAIELIAAARKKGIKVGVKQISDYPTVLSLSQNIYQESLKTNNDLNIGFSNSQKLSLLPNQSAYAFTKSMTVAIYLLRPKFNLHKETLEAALQEIIRRHEALRINFYSDGSEFNQSIGQYRSNAPILKCFKPNIEKTQFLKTVLSDYYQDLTTNLDIEKDDLRLRAALFEWNNEQAFFLAIDHYSFDELSMKLFWSELFLLYKQKRLPLVGVPYHQIIRTIDNLTQSWNYKEDQDFWLKQHEKIVRLPKTQKMSPEKSEGIKAKVLTFSDEEWVGKFLQHIPRITGMQINEMLLACWLQSISEWSNVIGLVTILGNHNRKLLDDMIHTMGCFVTAYPLYIELPIELDIRHAINVLRERSKEVPHGGSRYMLSMMNQPEWKEKVFALPQPSIGFNYLGEDELKQEMWDDWEFEVKGELVSVSNGELLPGRHQSTNNVPYLILHCQINSQRQKILLTCDYDSSYYDDLSIDKLLAIYQRRMASFTMQLAS